MLPEYYELGRKAAFSAADVHGQETAKSYDTMCSAYEVAADMEGALEEEPYPASYADLAFEDRTAFRNGYQDALLELEPNVTVSRARMAEVLGYVQKALAEVPDASSAAAKALFTAERILQEIEADINRT